MWHYALIPKENKNKTLRYFYVTHTVYFTHLNTYDMLILSLIFMLKNNFGEYWRIRPKNQHTSIKTFFVNIFF